MIRLMSIVRETRERNSASHRWLGSPGTPAASAESLQANGPRISGAVFSLILALACLSTVSGGDWPAFRGPNGNGISTETNVPLTWNADENVKWKVALPGPGNSSPIVVAGKVFVTCAQDEGKQRSLFCFDRQSGKQLWAKTVEFGKQACLLVPFGPE